MERAHEGKAFSTKNFSGLDLTEIGKGGVSKAWKVVSGGAPGSDCSAVGLECSGHLMGTQTWYDEAIKHCNVCCVGVEQVGCRWTGVGVGGGRSWGDGRSHGRPWGLAVLMLDFHATTLNCLTLGANLRPQEELLEQNQREIS